MTKGELAEAFAMAKRGDRDMEDMCWCDGFALPDFKPVVCTLRQLAGLIVWQCACFDGSWDMAALNEIAEFGKKKFMVIGWEERNGKEKPQHTQRGFCRPVSYRERENRPLA